MNKIERAEADTADLMRALGQAATGAAKRLARATSEEKNTALRAAAASLRVNGAAIVEANEIDVAAAMQAERPASFIDRLTLTTDRIEAMAAGLETIAELDDPVGATIAEWRRPNKLKI